MPLLFEILLNRWTVLVICGVFMFIGLKPDWTIGAVRMVGKMGWAERRLGDGGTYTVWKMIGVIAPIAGIIYFISGGYHPAPKSPVEETQTQYQADYGY